MLRTDEALETFLYTPDFALTKASIEARGS